MPVGHDLITRVSSYLHPHHGKTIADIRAVLSVKCSDRAIRYAVNRLVADGNARREGKTVFAAGDLVVAVSHDPGREPREPRPLLDCFPDDPDGYFGARADLLTHGTHEVGGGAAGYAFLKLAEAA
jgi:hypothetical protein